MCPNEILKTEQIVMMRYSRAHDLGELSSCENQLDRLASALRSLPYPHRPFAWRSVATGVGTGGSRQIAIHSPAPGAQTGVR